MEEPEAQRQPVPIFSPPPTPHSIPTLWLRAAGVAVFVSLILQHGFPVGAVAVSILDWFNVLLALVFATDAVLTVVQAKKRKAVFALRRAEYYLLAGLVVSLVVTWLLAPGSAAVLVDFLRLHSRAGLTFNLVKLYLLLSLCIQLLRGTQRLFGKGVRAELILAGSFATLIVIGSFLLLLPNASARVDAPIGFVDAIFTATSASCVTGLTVRDTGTDFSAFGQAIILTLVQVGGLGIITFVGFLSVFSTRTLPVPQMVAFRHMVNAPRLSDVKRQLAGILLAAGVIELCGAMVLYQFAPEGEPLERILWSLFHAVSAFCNSGFALQSDSLESYRASPGIALPIMALIILGGLGFLAISELVRYRVTRGRWFRRLGFFRRLHAGQAPARLTVQTKLSLSVMGLLLLAGFIGFWMLEAGHTLHGRPVHESILTAAFHSVTPRSCGFNTVPIGQLQDATLVLIMALMMIGASPVSTGGGIKTVGFGIMLLALRSVIMRRERVEAFGRTIPARTLFAALSVFVIYILCAMAGMFLVAIFDPQLSFRDRAFEVISALSTVGLSTGITAELSPASKLVLCVAMFVGRVGPISLVLSVFQSRQALAYEFPEEEVVVG